MKAEKIIRLRIQNSTFCRRIRVVQGDTGRIFRFILEDITMDGSEQARVYAKKPDGTEVYNDCEVVSPNEVLMESDSGQIFAAIGVVQAEIQISKSGKTITTYTFEFDVEKSLTRAGAIQSSSEYGALETAIAKAEGFYNPTFSEAATRNNINSGESIPTLFGKVKKWFTDLNTLIKLVGSADISGIGKGTVTDALLTLNSKQIRTKNITEIFYFDITVTTGSPYGDFAFYFDGFEYNNDPAISINPIDEVSFVINSFLINNTTEKINGVRLQAKKNGTWLVSTELSVTGTILGQ